jgi:photosystem II stability/assembly factor-like uncharacterized protein
MNSPPADGFVQSLVVDPQDSGTLYAASSYAGNGNAGLNSVFKSTDGGVTWRSLQSGSVFGLAAPLAIDPQNSSIVYSGNYNDIFKSTDGGRTWKSSSAGMPLTCCLIPNTLAIDPINPVNVYAALSIGLFKSTDRGASWRAVYPYTGPQQPQFESVVLDPRNSGVLYGLSGGVYKSTDGGITWIAVNSGLPASQSNSSYYPVTSLTIDPQDNNTLYAGTSAGLYKSTDGGTTWRRANSGLAGAVGPIAVDPWNSGTLYASSSPFSPPGNGGVYKSTDAGANWVPSNLGIRAVRIASIVADPQRAGTLYASSGVGRLKSTDGGTTWQTLTTAPGGVLAIDPKDTNTLYAGDVKAVAKSRDGGATWVSVRTGLPDGCTYVSSLAIDPQDTGTVYAAFQGGGDICLSRQNVVGGLWQSTDGGITWMQVGSQPKGGGLHGVVIDPLNTSSIYGWNGMGLYKSPDRGVSWQTLDLGVTDKDYVYTVVVNPRTTDTLYAVTGSHGILKSVDGAVIGRPLHTHGA